MAPGARQADVGDEALALVRRSLEIEETPDNKALFVLLVRALEAVGNDAALRALVTRAALEGWGAATDLAPVAAVNQHHDDRGFGPVVVLSVHGDLLRVVLFCGRNLSRGKIGQQRDYS